MTWPWLYRVKAITHLAQRAGEDKDRLIRNTIEELGEYAAAVSIEDGTKPNKELKEPSKVEAIDTIICACSLYFAAGGTVREFEQLAIPKLNKWLDRIKAKLTVGENDAAWRDFSEGISATGESV